MLALQKTLEGSDFDRLTPAPSDLEVRSTLAERHALAALAEAEALVAQTQDAILQLPPDRETGGFVNYVWFILHALELVPDLANTRTWQDIVTRLFAFTQLPDDLKARWLALADIVAARYAQTPPASRRRWAQAGTSLGSAAAIESIAAASPTRCKLLAVSASITLDETLDILAEPGRLHPTAAAARGEPSTGASGCHPEAHPSRSTPTQSFVTGSPVVTSPSSPTPTSPRWRTRRSGSSRWSTGSARGCSTICRGPSVSSSPRRTTSCCHV